MGNEQSQFLGPNDGNRNLGSEFDWGDPLKVVLGPPTNRGSSTGGKSGEGGTWHQQQQQQRGRRRGDDAEIPGYIVEDSIGGIRGAGSAHLGRAQSQTRNGDSSLNFATSTEQHRQHRQQQQKLASKAAPGSAGIQGRSSYLAESSLSASEAEQGRQRDEGRDSAPEIWEPRTKSKTTIAGGEASMGDDKDDGESAAGEVPDVAVLAVRESHLEALDLMVENGELEDVNGKDATGDTLLCIAVKPNRFKSVLWLCNNGADIHTRGRGGRLPLSIAQQLGHKGLEKFLSVWSNIALNSPLHLAALQGNLRGLQLALSTSQVMINSAEPFGHHTPLQLAVKQQHFECAELLIQRKANLDLQHPLSLETPLATAVLLHNDALVMLLIQGGATIKNHLNRPLAIWAVDRQCSERIVNIILACQRLQAGGDRGGGGDTSSDSDGLDGFKDVSDDEDEDASLNKAASTVSIRPRSVSPTKPTAPVPSTERLVPTDLFESLVSPVSLRPAQQPPPISRSPPSVISTCKACGTDVMSDMRRIKDQDGYFHDNCYKKLREAVVAAADGPAPEQLQVLALPPLPPASADGPAPEQQPRPHALDVVAERHAQVQQGLPESQPPADLILPKSLPGGPLPVQVLALPPLPPASVCLSSGRHTPASKTPETVREENEVGTDDSSAAGQGTQDVEISRETKVSGAGCGKGASVEMQFRELAVGSTKATGDGSVLQRAMRLKEEEAKRLKKEREEEAKRLKKEREEEAKRLEKEREEEAKRLEKEREEEAKRLKSSSEAGRVASMAERDRGLQESADQGGSMFRDGADAKRMDAGVKAEELWFTAMERNNALAREAAEEREAAKKKVKAMRIQSEMEASKRIEEAGRASYEKEAKVREAAQIAVAERNRDVMEARAEKERLESEKALFELSQRRAAALMEEAKRAEIERLETINKAEKERVRERLARQREEEARRQEEMRRVAQYAGEARREAEARERRQEEEMEMESEKRMQGVGANGSNDLGVRNSPPGYKSIAVKQSTEVTEEEKRLVQEKRRADYMAVLQMQREAVNPVATKRAASPVTTDRAVGPSAVSPSAADNAVAEEISIAPPVRKLTLNNEPGVVSESVQLPYDEESSQPLYEEEIVQPLQNVKVDEVLVVEVDYEADYVDELDLVEGQQVLVTGEANDPGWIIGLCDGRKGLVPLTHVRRPNEAANESVVSLS